MKFTASLISGVSEQEVKARLAGLNIDALEVTRLNWAEGACSAQSVFYKLFEKRVFESEENVREALEAFSWCKSVPNAVFGSPSLRDANSEQEMVNAIMFFREYVEMYGNTISIEPLHRSYGTGFVNTYREAISFIELVGEDRVMVNLDLGSACIDDDDFSVERVAHVHLSGRNARALDERDKGYYVKSLKKLERLGYDGYVSLESFNFYDDARLYEEIIACL